jgi:amino acid adenylation domain-containing protein
MNGTHPGSTVVDLFREQARESAGRISVEWPGDSWTYRRLDRESDRIASALTRAGTGSGAFVGVLFDREPWLYAAMIGVLKAGSAYLPLWPGDPPGRISRLAASAGIAALVTSDRYGTLLPDRRLRVIDVGKLPGRPIISPGSAPGPDDLAYVVYTSGSTGAPKGVMVAHRGVANLVRWAGAEFAISPGSRVLQSYPPVFDASVQEVFTALVCGATICPVPDRVTHSPGRFLDWLREQRISHCDLVPTYWRELARQAATRTSVALPDLRVLILGGEPLHGRDVDAWRSAVPVAHRIFNLYGPTEATVTATWHEVSAPCRGDVPIGKPIPGVQALVLDEAGRPCEHGAEGELYLGGAGIARGYLHDDRQTAASFVDHPAGPGSAERVYRTGDFVRREPDGTGLVFVGRRDDQVSVRGHRVELGEVAAAVRRCPQVRDAAVAFVPSGPGDDPWLVCWFVPDGPDVDPHAVRRYLRGQVPAHLVPRRLYAADRLPSTASGKLDRRRLASAPGANLRPYIQ